MRTLKTFDHDGSSFEIKAELSDGSWKVHLFCDGNELREPAIVSDEVVLANAANKIMLLPQIANELEMVVKKAYDLKVSKET